METLVSSWYNNIQSVPRNFVVPLEEQPGKINVRVGKTIPIVDLGKADGPGRAEIIQQILQGSKDFGLFQVINHGVANDLMDDTESVLREFFELPPEDKASFCSVDTKQSCRLYTSTLYYDTEEVHNWRNNWRHPCYPVEDSVHLWPENPTRYREVVGTYSVEVRKAALRILELIGEGLGLESGYFGGVMTAAQILSANYYPPCPDPSVTLGLAKHCDPNVITLLQQGDVYGLNVYKDGQWFGVEPIRHALVVNIGYQLQIISNGKLRGALHRAVTNSREARTSIVIFINPSDDCIIGPAKALVNTCSPQLYRSFQYKEFVRNYLANMAEPATTLEPYQLQA